MCTIMFKGGLSFILLFYIEPWLNCNGEIADILWNLSFLKLGFRLLYDFLVISLIVCLWKDEEMILLSLQSITNIWG